MATAVKHPTVLITRTLIFYLSMAKYRDDGCCSAGLRPASFAAHRAALQGMMSLYFAIFIKLVAMAFLGVLPHALADRGKFRPSRSCPDWEDVVAG